MKRNAIQICLLDLSMIMTNDLAASDETVKFVNDTTLWEIISTEDSSSHLPATVSSCSEWSLVNNMICIKDQRITIHDQDVDVVSEAKLLGRCDFRRSQMESPP